MEADKADKQWGYGELEEIEQAGPARKESEWVIRVGNKILGIGQKGTEGG